jgi:phage terminase Nu1 subunit (DNA packaging protein)
MSTILAHPQNQEQLNAIKAVLKALKVPFEQQDEVSFPELTKSDIDQAYKELRAGQYTVIEADDLWK